MPNLTVLQINIDRGRAAYNLLLETAVETHSDILIVAEPSRDIVNSSVWLTDHRNNAAVRILNSKIPMYGTGGGNGYVWIDTGDSVIYSCYFSPNADVAAFEADLDHLKEDIIRSGKQAIIAGDFNAKAPEWGMPHNDRRGDILTAWIAELGLIIANEGNQPTFTRGASKSIIDITLVTERLSSRVGGWKVLEQESLSCHSYITFTIAKSGNPTAKLGQERFGWNLKKLNERHFTAQLKRGLEDSDTTTAEELTTVLSSACDRSMPRRRPCNRRSTYWWNKEIADFRKACTSARRLASRSNISEEVRFQRRQQYKEMKKTLRKMILSAKKTCWKRLLADVDQDIWGKGYQIVVKRLNASPSGVGHCKLYFYVIDIRYVSRNLARVKEVLIPLSQANKIYIRENTTPSKRSSTIQDENNDDDDENDDDLSISEADS
ncbi:unnamed protein product [Callosobruchus maculatus]|uniref:Endonuclease/exonuclease/phosphatase domain-containing protein n=1 Tax=Callosobruchus maculatus TaxID=64391 RepID=A0A653C951_CALMS|nr:unnamed protein product [Callosobruchus maculatus]